MIYKRKICLYIIDYRYILNYSIERISQLFNLIYDHDGIRHFDYTIIYFVKNYNKEHNKQLLVKIDNKLGNEEFKIFKNKVAFINDD